MRVELKRANVLHRSLLGFNIIQRARGEDRKSMVNGHGCSLYGPGKKRPGRIRLVQLQNPSMWCHRETRARPAPDSAKSSETVPAISGASSEFRMGQVDIRDEG